MTSSNSNDSISTGLDSSNLLVFFYRYWKPIIILCFLAAVVSAIASYMIEEKYRSTVTMYATGEGSFGAQLLEEVNKEDIMAFGETEDAERLLQVLNSDKIRNRVIEKFDLWKHYDINREDPGSHTIIGKEYSSNVSASLTRYGSVKVDVLDKDPKNAMEMANYIAEMADTVSNNMIKDRASHAFAYAQQSYDNLMYELKVLEDSMSILQNYGLYDLESQVEVLTDRYGAALASGQSGRADQIKAELDKIGKHGNAFVKLQTMIESNLEKEAVLKKRYDQMKIDMTTNLSVKNIVDSAAISDKKAYPVRWLIVALSVMGTFVFAVIFLLIRESLINLRREKRI